MQLCYKLYLQLQKELCHDDSFMISYTTIVLCAQMFATIANPQDDMVMISALKYHIQLAMGFHYFLIGDLVQKNVGIFKLNCHNGRAHK